MNSLEMSAWLEKDQSTKSIFIGVFARDELPDIKKLPACFILNTENRSQAGEHWLAFYYNKHGIAYFFDSYGKSPAFFQLENYLNKTSIEWIHNRKRLQGKSQYCGIYCLLFLSYCSRQQTRNFFALFSDNFDLNDKKITFNLMKHYD